MCLSYYMAWEPGNVARVTSSSCEAGGMVAKVKAALAEVIPFHLDGLRAGGEAVPLPESGVEWVEV